SFVSSRVSHELPRTRGGRVAGPVLRLVRRRIVHRMKVDLSIRRLGPPQSASDSDLRQAALSILQHHPEWAEEAAGLVRRWLEKPALSPEQQIGLRTLLLAFQAQRLVQDIVVE